MMDMRRLTRDARLSFARLPGLANSLGVARLPDGPHQPVRDLWPGDAAAGARLMRGELLLAGLGQPLAPGTWPEGGEARAVAVRPLSLPAYAQGFTWLRDLRALGTDGARLRGRALIADWLQRPSGEPAARLPEVIGARVTAWLAHYDFFVSSADDTLRQRVMARLIADSRLLAAMVPMSQHDHRAFTGYKGLLAAAIAIPDQGHLLSRFMRHIGAELGRQVLLDGCHVERSPAAHLSALRDLAEMRALMQIAQIAPPLALSAAIDRMAPVLRAFRHADGGLALFNGSQQDNPAMLDLLLSQAARARGAQAALPEGGFLRLAVGRTLLFVDAGPPPPSGYDALAHAGTLSIELSVGRERMIVGCGTSAAPAWQDALRATAAHSTLTVADHSSSDFASGEQRGISRRPAHVEVDHKQSGGAHWLELSHDGYKPGFGAVHRRRLYLGESGEDIRGEDLVEAPKPVAFVLRFHLHPDVSVRRTGDTGSLTLQLASGAEWRMRIEGGAVSVEDSIYAGLGAPQPTRQIAVSVDLPEPQSEAAGELLAGEPQIVRWALSRLET